MEDHQHHA
jgi:hypothetical protein